MLMLVLQQMMRGFRGTLAFGWLRFCVIAAAGRAALKAQKVQNQLFPAS
jgi:hypothetical protein